MTPIDSIPDSWERHMRDVIFCCSVYGLTMFNDKKTGDLSGFTLRQQFKNKFKDNNYPFFK